MLTEASLLTRYMGQVVSEFLLRRLSISSFLCPGEQKKNYLGITSEALETFVESFSRSISPARKASREKRLYPSYMMVMKNELCLSTGNVCVRKEKVAYQVTYFLSLRSSVC